MTQEERDAIRARCDKATPEPWYIMKSMLDALDSETKRVDYLKDEIMGWRGILLALSADRDHWKELALDRECTIECLTLESQSIHDRWKARAEALEQAIKSTYGAPSTGCEVCVYDTYDNKVCYSDCKDKSHWQFDEARFAVKS